MTSELFTSGRGGHVLHLGEDERALLSRLLGELREVVTDPAPGEMASRLFPVVHPDLPDQEAEYQRLTRSDLVSSRLGALDVVDGVLRRQGRTVTMDEAEMMSFVQAVNALRLVLGTALGVTEDDDVESADQLASPQYQLYAYLSWVLDAAIRQLSG
ncbi:MAG: DUF2017 family protein [Ilumatobacteraceae bacterium]